MKWANNRYGETRIAKLVWVDLEEKVCWLCGGKDPDTEIETNAETPGGKRCKTKTVSVHTGCHMDMVP